jgi:hypothetical protein
MKIKKEDYFAIALGIILIIIVFIIAAITSYFSKSNEPTEQTQSPTSAPTQMPRVNPENDPEQIGPHININAEDQMKLLDRVNNRKQLSNKDLLVKGKVLTLLPEGQKSGALYESKNIIIDYISSADLFQVEILTINIQQAKDEANVWFREQGFSQYAICEYPVMFYLNSDVSRQLRDLNIKFSPVGNSC